MRVSAEQRRRELAAAALRVVVRDGVAAATIRAIVAEAGMKLASFHYAYRSRDEVLREVVRLVVEGERETTAAALAEAAAPPASGRADEAGGPELLAALTRRTLGAYLASVHADPGREQGMLELTFTALRTPELEGVAAEQYAQYRGLVAEILAAGAELAGMRWTAPLEELARAIVAISDGLTVAALVDPDADLEPVLDLLVPALVARAEPALTAERIPG
ncbi:MAG: TetR family transcriptional regulator C-terminal domain-containing protein [Actinomycetales bacterium]|nr:TetR family transcriptional regulator C-terminal domain-containing protein [Actinomycetales bacterium]